MADQTQTKTDTFGLVDDGTADILHPFDILGLADSVTAQHTSGDFTKSDPLGLADSITVTSGLPSFWTRAPVGWTRNPVAFTRRSGE